MQFCSVDKCKNVNFGIDKLTRLPFCANHQYKRTDLDRRSIASKAMSKRDKASTQIRSLQNEPSNIALLEEKGIVDNQEKKMLELWYLACKYEMTGKCEECGAWTNKTNDKYYRWSCCHIVAKAYVKSVAVNPSNWIELCQIHHQEYDAGFERAKRMKCFDLIKRKFKTFKDQIPDSEKRWINPHLLT